MKAVGRRDRKQWHDGVRRVERVSTSTSFGSYLDSIMRRCKSSLSAGFEALPADTQVSVEYPDLGHAVLTFVLRARLSEVLLRVTK